MSEPYRIAPTCAGCIALTAAFLLAMYWILEVLS